MRLFLLLAAQAFARAGGGEGYSGGSSGSSFSSSSSGGGDAGFIFDLLYLYIRFVIAFPVFGVPLTVFFAYFAYLYLQASSSRRAEGLIGAGLQRQTELKLRGEREELRGRDPGFDEAAFLKRVSAAFVKVQTAWSLGDMPLARPFVSDGVYERFTRQLKDLRARGLTNVMADVKVLDAEALGYESDRHFDALHVWIKASASDKTVDAAGNVLRSSNGAFEEVWSFLRRPTAKTLKAGGGIEGQCPSCGAVLSVADAGKCAACGSWVNSGAYDWVLAEITQRSEWAGGDSHRDVDGWPAFSHDDPALNLQVLEDRASVVFWRWLEALRRREAAPLLPVASAEAAGAALAEAGGVSWRDAAVGSAGCCERGRDGPARQRALRHARDRADRPRVAVQRAHAAAGPHRLGLRAPARPRRPAHAGQRRRQHRRAADGRGPPPLASAAPALAGAGVDDPVALGDVAGAQRRGPAEGGDRQPPWPASQLRAKPKRGDAAQPQRNRQRTGREVRRQDQLAPRPVPAAGLLDAPQPADGAQAEAMLRGLIRMSLADGRVTDGEHAALSAFGRRFGLHANDVKGFVEEERAALLKRLR